MTCPITGKTKTGCKSEKTNTRVTPGITTPCTLDMSKAGSLERHSHQHRPYMHSLTRNKQSAGNKALATRKDKEWATSKNKALATRTRSKRPRTETLARKRLRVRRRMHARLLAPSVGRKRNQRHTQSCTHTSTKKQDAAGWPRSTGRTSV